MERRRLMPLRLFSSDLDGTLAGDRAASARFAEFWRALPPETRPLLVYNSGRLVDDILEFTREEGLPVADIVIGGVGTMMASDRHPRLTEAYRDRLGGEYDADRVGALLETLPGLERQPARYQHALKSSWYFHDATSESLAELEARLIGAGLSVRVVYSSNRDLDILPASADKGQAIAWLAQHLGIGLDAVAVAGDTGNDAGMFDLPLVRGIIPANGLPELKSRFGAGERIHHASRAHADGVVEGLRTWLFSDQID